MRERKGNGLAVLQGELANGHAMKYGRPAHPLERDHVGTVALGPPVVLEDTHPLWEEERDISQDVAQVETQVDGPSAEARHAVHGDDLLGSGGKTVHCHSTTAVLNRVQDQYLPLR